MIDNTFTLEIKENNSLTIDNNSSKESVDQTLVTIQKTPLSSHLLNINIAINPIVVANLHKLVVNLLQKKNLDGFFHNATPIEHIEDHFKNEIKNKSNNFILKKIVLNSLIKFLQTEKIQFASYPRLSKIDNNSTLNYNYSFDVSTIDSIEFKEWKNFSFKSPKRKRYKDLDKQVINYLEEESCNTKKMKLTAIENSDWIFFETLLVDKDNVPLMPYIKNSYWMQFKQNETNNPLSQIFIDKKINDSFISPALDFTETESLSDNQHFSYLITINSLVKGSHLSLELLRNMFKLKNKADIHNKLMEVFSYRNDVSQRKLIIEEMFHLLLSKHRFEVPKHLILRRQEDIIHSLSKQPDYQVYKAQKKFESYVELLAEKQLKEEILIDQITLQENITYEISDMQQYLHLFNNKRLREFVYFKPLLEGIDEPNTPINEALLSSSVLREKTLNYIIHSLTR